MDVVGTRLAGAGDVALVADIAARGFQDDPIMAWVFPDAAARPAQLRMAFAGLASTYLAEGLIHVLADACTSLWRPPAPTAAAPPPAAPAAPEEHRRGEGTSPFSPEVLERFAVLTAVMEAAHPGDPHWYLGVLSTVPERQSQGLGASTLAPVLGRCDTGAVPAYLESSNPRNIPFYRRQGFAVVGEIRVPGGPSLFPMWRDPRPA